MAASESSAGVEDDEGEVLADLDINLGQGKRMSLGTMRGYNALSRKARSGVLGIRQCRLIGSGNLPVSVAGRHKGQRSQFVVAGTKQ